MELLQASLSGVQGEEKNSLNVNNLLRTCHKSFCSSTCRFYCKQKNICSLLENAINFCTSNYPYATIVRFSNMGTDDALKIAKMICESMEKQLTGSIDVYAIQDPKDNGVSEISVYIAPKGMLAKHWNLKEMFSRMEKTNFPFLISEEEKNRFLSHGNKSINEYLRFYECSVKRENGGYLPPTYSEILLYLLLQGVPYRELMNFINGCLMQ